MKRLAHLAGHARPATGVPGVALLGSEHPLVRAAELLQNLTRQSLPVAAVLVFGPARGSRGQSVGHTPDHRRRAGY